jgi:ketosteroid isomerase-like protein
VAAEAEEVRALVQETIDGFNRGDADAYMAMAHDAAVIRNGGTNSFARGAEMRQLAPMIVAAMKRFDVVFEGTEVIGDTALLWGTFENVLRGPEDADGDVLVGQFTITCTRLHGQWMVACSHYSVI